MKFRVHFIIIELTALIVQEIQKIEITELQL